MCQVHYRQVRKEKTMGRAPDALVSGIKETPPTKGLGFPIPSTADTPTGSSLAITLATRYV